MLGLLNFGVVIEFTETITGWHYRDWEDWLAHVVGVAMAYGIWKVAQQVWFDNPLIGDHSLWELNP